VQSSSATASSVRSNPDGDDDEPRRIGKYELLRLIARGGMGEVHLARLPGELGFEKRLVIKTIRADLATDPRFVEMFAAEAKTAVALSHPNIAPIYELGRAADGTLYTAMGWVDGPSLQELLQRLRALDQTLELGAALFITRELLDGLAHAHSRDRERPPVVHRDITPRNVLVDRSGRVQIVDFGIARPVAAEVGGMMGSAGYMAPEQARGEPVDPRADVFSVGCVLYELLTNQRAFTGEGVWMLPSFARVPEPVRDVLERALALAADQRYADAAAFLRSLAPILAEHAPLFGTRDLAAILVELFGEDRELHGEDRTGERTPVTRISAAVETFATRASVEPSASPSPSIEAPVEVTSRPRRRAFAWVTAGLLTIGVVLLGYVLAQPDTPAAEARLPAPPQPESREPEQAQPQPPPEPTEPSEPSQLIMPAAIANVSLELHPPDASVLLDGEALRGPPYVIALTGDRSVELRVEHPEHRPLTRTLDVHTSTTEPIVIELEPLEFGTLTVLAPTVAWAEVWVDGSKLGNTPLIAKPVLEGKHKLEVRCAAAVCGTAQVLLEQSIRVRPGRALELEAKSQ
jgi:serine/threonine protein kinase